MEEMIQELFKSSSSGVFTEPLLSPVLSLESPVVRVSMGTMKIQNSVSEHCIPEERDKH
jgi:hypothetical protein